jgi:hypothetical protein
VRHSISIWFIIGALLVVYGALILATGIIEAIHPRPTAVVLANLHVAVWWGAGMLVIGTAYVVRHWPLARRNVIDSGSAVSHR